MSAMDALLKLARGERPRDAILPPCRLTGLGSEAYGEEAIVNHFRQVPFEGLETACAITTARNMALFAGKAALIADLHNGRLQRIWRLGAEAPRPAEPAVGVPFDTDLFQARRDTALRREDHPHLDPQAFDGLCEVGYRLAHGWTHADGPSVWRTRPFAIRAFSNGESAAALFAIHRLGSGVARSAGFSFAAALFGFGANAGTEPKIVRDIAGENAVENTVWRTGFA